MSKRPFLAPLAALAAALTSGQSTAALLPATPLQNLKGADANQPQVQQSGTEVINATSGENVFSFILKRGEDGQMMAYHTSHSSHASHASHSSHSSHYSGS